MAEHILQSDNLNEGRVKLNAAIDASDRAESKSDSAVSSAQQAVITAIESMDLSEQTKLEMTNIIREQTSGADVVPEVVQARGTEATLGNRLNSVDSQLAETFDNVNERGLNIKYPPVPMVGVKADGIIDDTIAFQNLVKQNKKLIFPDDVTLLISNTINLSGVINWEGGYYRNSKIKFTGIGNPLFKAINDGSSGLANYSIISNIRLIGNGTTQNQTAFDLQGYIFKMKNVEISDFTNSGIVSGVYVYVEDSYIHNNVNGFIVRENLEHTSKISTMIRFKDNIFTENSGVAITNYHNGKYTNVVNIIIDSNGFELGGQAFDLLGYQNLKVSSCWFEGNNEKPTLMKFNTITENNYFNGGITQELEYVDVPSGTYTHGSGGVSRIDSKGNSSFKQISFQYYDNAFVRDIGRLKLVESEKNTKRYLKLTDDRPYALRTVNAEKTFFYPEEFHIYINDSTLSHDLPDKLAPVLTKIGTGDYEILFASTLEYPIINANAMANTMYDSSISLVCGFYGTYTIDGATFNSYTTMNKLRVRCYNIANANVLTDAKVMISIKPRYK